LTQIVATIPRAGGLTGKLSTCYAPRYYAPRSKDELLASLSDLGRFSEPALLVMTSLAEGPKHGYAIQDDIASLTGVRPGPGTLYGAIRRLEENGLIVALPERDRRKPYELTGAGRAALQAELRRMHTVATTGLRRLAAA